MRHDFPLRSGVWGGESLNSLHRGLNTSLDIPRQHPRLPNSSLTTPRQNSRPQRGRVCVSAVHCPNVMYEYSKCNTYPHPSGIHTPARASTKHFPRFDTIQMTIWFFLGTLEVSDSPTQNIFFRHAASPSDDAMPYHSTTGPVLGIGKSVTSVLLRRLNKQPIKESRTTFDQPQACDSVDKPTEK